MSTHPKRIDLSFAEVELYPDYVISSIKPGVFFDFKHLEELSTVFKSHFKSRPFISVADRKFEYSINPSCLLESDFIPNLLGIAVVCHTPAAYTAAKFEKQFYDNPFKVFHNLENALDWGKELLAANRK